MSYLAVSITTKNMINQSIINMINNSGNMVFSYYMKYLKYKNKYMLYKSKK